MLGLSRSGLTARRWKAAAAEEEPLASILVHALGLEWCPCLEEQAAEAGGVPLDC